MAKLELHATDQAVLVCGWFALAAVVISFATCEAVSNVAESDVHRACVNKTGNRYCNPARGATP